jgi:hypothetical protein
MQHQQLVHPLPHFRHAIESGKETRPKDYTRSLVYHFIAKHIAAIDYELDMFV